MKTNRAAVLSIFLTLSVLVSGAVAAWAFLFSANDSQGQQAADADTARALTPTPGPALPPGNDIAAAGFAAAAANPVVAKLLEAVKAGSLTGLLALYPFQERPCTARDARVGNTPSCADLGLRDGELVQVYPVDIGEIAFAGQRYMADKVGERLNNGHPRLALIARTETGDVYVSFAVDVSPSGVDSLNFLVSSEPSNGILLYGGGVPTYTLFDRFRDEERMDPSRRYTILGASQESLDREAIKHELRTRGNKVP